MSRFIKIFLLMCIFVNTSFLVFAEKTVPEIDVAVTGYEVKISGSADAYEGTEVSIIVVRPGKDIFSVVEDTAATEVTLLNNNALCIAQTSIDADKEFEFTCKFDSNEKSGNYKLRVQVYGEENLHEETIRFENASRTATALSNLQTNDASVLKGVLEEYATDIHIESGEKYILFSNKEKEYVYTNVASETTDKKQKYMDCIGEIQAVRDLKALNTTALKTKIDGGNVVGVGTSEISGYNALSSFNKEVFVSDLYTAIREKETPVEVGATFSATLLAFNNSFIQVPPGNTPPLGNSSSSSGSFGGGSSSSSVSISGNVATNSDKPYVIETPTNEGFLDVGNTHWAKIAINTLFERGIIKGRGENIFSPNDTVTREEFLKMVIESLNIVGISEDKKSFTDVDSSAWYVHYVETGLGTGVINGISDTEFGVGLPIKREDMATILYRAVKYGEVSLYSTVDIEFTDKASISEYAVEAVEALSSAKVINGMEDGSFMPKKTATRAEAAMMLYNLLYR